MRNLNLMVLLVLLISLVACVSLPIKKDIREGHFRLKNFQFEQGKKREYVYLMCNSKSPSQWVTARQYEAGRHILWVKASIGSRDFSSAERNAFVKFEVDLESGKDYQLNREIVGDSIIIWIAEGNGSNINILEKLTSPLTRPLVIEERLRKDQCLEGTI
ncbi:hypothetical protein H5154_22220 [Pseudoalteromonas sp. SR44-5]|uniref:DUF2846 domain-containing protein n=1 Tax=Pseudoalteromonas rhizosphaerae TaxID=2518973 RepID=A0ABW8KU36_9GAMM|nr:MULTISPECIES: hypothetical protein [unclassified Pseudoalteromonas]MBB1335993.1 hypothetical protein [Pseudoalteromonas sp. SR41-6]MBB1344298.1 hypothetical protein [Pseudoalteromonas sp. SR45-6]MBB1369054.1 hypothetical protein [Pseudoalteromonas sp. SR44-5]MBB1424693.1 hypothetical protein [Pseudoalteromonas sp. SG43-7]MBB1461558.1 hypothetical protein [Pseudoalteromonas sp. SG41-8]